MKRIVLLFIVYIASLFGGEEIVKITEDIPYVYINDSGVKVKISRIQDTANKLTDDYAKTSRVCPPFCIPPIQVVKGVKTIGELELIDFIKNKVYKNRGILVDARLKKLYTLETIPGALNIPFTLTEIESKKVINSLFTVLNVNKNDDGTYNFSKAKDIAAFCSGIWCEQSTRFIKGIVKHGYPADKILWYRGGFQAWKLLGLTTVVHKAKEVKNRK